MPRLSRLCSPIYKMKITVDADGGVEAVFANGDLPDGESLITIAQHDAAQCGTSTVSPFGEVPSSGASSTTTASSGSESSAATSGASSASSGASSSMRTALLLRSEVSLVSRAGRIVWSDFVSIVVLFSLSVCVVRVWEYCARAVLCLLFYSKLLVVWIRRSVPR